MIDKSLAERDANIDKMCTHIDKDIVSLNKEVKEVKQKAQVRWPIPLTDKWLSIPPVGCCMQSTGST